MQNKYLIISPCFNIERYADEHILKLKTYSNYCDILLIDDCSSDNTLKIITESGLPYVQFKKRSGKAAALKFGFLKGLEGKYDAVLTIDSDLQHSHQSIPEFIAQYENSLIDYVIGSRSFSLVNMPLSRILSNRLSSWILSRIGGTQLLDSQCGFRLIDRKYLQIETVSDGFQFESEHLVKSIWNGATLSHVQIPTIYNGALSSMKYLKDTAKFIRLFWQLIRQKKLLMESTINEQV